MAEKEVNGPSYYPIDITKRWFSTKINDTDVCTYILDNTWHKPRDIVRMLLAAQSRSSKNATMFNQSTFDIFMPTYSKQCLIEVKEEMRALYTATEIDQIVSCLQGYKTVFSLDEIKDRVKNLYPDSVFASDAITVLKDLYRIGMIGNLFEKTDSYRWEYKEQYGLLIDDTWKMVIHPALRLELSVSGRRDKYIRSSSDLRIEIEDTILSDGPKIGEIYQAQIRRISGRYVIVDFVKDGFSQEGYITINNLGYDYIMENTIEELFSVGDTLAAMVLSYNYLYKNWYMRVVRK